MGKELTVDDYWTPFFEIAEKVGGNISQKKLKEVGAELIEGHDLKGLQKEVKEGIEQCPPGETKSCIAVVLAGSIRLPQKPSSPKA